MLRRLFFLAVAGLAAAENGLNAWLRYAPLPTSTSASAAVPTNIIGLNDTVGSPVYVASIELQNGISGILFYIIFID